MKVFAYDRMEGINIPSDKPAEMDFGQAYRILDLLFEKNSFIGVELGNGAVLQIQSDGDEILWIELLDTRNKTTVGCQADHDVATVALKAAYESADIRASLEPYNLSWESSSIKPKT